MIAPTLVQCGDAAGVLSLVGAMFGTVEGGADDRCHHTEGIAVSIPISSRI